jgi:hypothetical protein
MKLGTHHSKETRMKMRKPHRKYVMSEETLRKLVEERKARVGIKHPLFGKPLSEEHCKKISKANSGDNCHFWKGGISFAPYCVKFNRARKKATRNFFGNVCIVCGSHTSELRRDLHVHHIEHDKDEGCSGRLFNLVPLCISCHAIEQGCEKEYKSYINRTIEEGFKWGIWNREQYELEVMYPEQSEVEMIIAETTISIPAGV